MDIEALVAERMDAIDSVYLSLPQTKQAHDAIDATRRARRQNGCTYCSLIYGKSGTGKTIIFERYCNAQKVKPDGTNPVLFVRVPAPFNQGAFARSFLKELKLPMIPRQDLDTMMDRIVQGLQKSGIELVLLDEISHAVDHRKRDGSIPYWVTDQIKMHFLDEAKVPVVMNGVPISTELFTINEQLRTRRLRMHEIRPYDIDKAEDCEALTILLESMEKRAGFSRRLFEGNEEILRRMHAATGGIHLILTTLMKEAVTLATRSGEDRLSVAILAEACAMRAEPGGDWFNPFLVNPRMLGSPGSPPPDETRVTALHKRARGR